MTTETLTRRAAHAARELLAEVRHPHVDAPHVAGTLDACSACQSVAYVLSQEHTDPDAFADLAASLPTATRPTCDYWNDVEPFWYYRLCNRCPECRTYVRRDYLD